MRSEFKSESVKRDFRQFLVFGLGYGVVLILGYLLLRKINLSLSELEMGRYSYVFALINILMPVFYLAAPQAYLRFHDEHRVSPRLRKYLLPLFFVSSVGLAAVVGYETHSPWALLVAAYPFFNERLYVFRAQMRTITVNVLKVCEIGVPLVALYALPLLGTHAPDVTSSLVIGLYGLGFLTAFCFPLHLEGESSPDCRTLGIFLVPVVVTTVVATLIENLTVVIAKQLLGLEASAQMGIAARNLIFIRALFQVFLMFYPVVYFREMSKGRLSVVRLYRAFILFVSTGFVAIFAIFAPLVYRLTGAEAYLDTSHVFVILAFAMLCDFIFEIYGLYFQHEIKTWKATIVKSLTLVLMFTGFSVVALMRPSVTAFAASVLAASFASSIAGLVWALRREKAHSKQDAISVQR